MAHVFPTHDVEFLVFALSTTKLWVSVVVNPVGPDGASCNPARQNIHKIILKPFGFNKLYVSRNYLNVRG